MTKQQLTACVVAQKKKQRKDDFSDDEDNETTKVDIGMTKAHSKSSKKAPKASFAMLAMDAESDQVSIAQCCLGHFLFFCVSLSGKLPLFSRTL